MNLIKAAPRVALTIAAVFAFGACAAPVDDHDPEHLGKASGPTPGIGTLANPASLGNTDGQTTTRKASP